MKIAVEGCCHGELDAIYQTLELLEQKNNIKVDLLLICGDFQSVRNKADMECMAVPAKYRQMNTFYKYYSGEKVAPVLTVFIGGNHEASNYLQELPYGGWVAPKIYYMGYGNVVQFGGVRIGGMSGIYKGKDYMKGHFEHPPYREETKRSAYHIRNIDVFRLKQLKQHVDIFLSHDWPKGIYKYGNVNKLLKKKKFLREEIEKDILGNPVAEELLHLLQPTYWFSAHLHVKFPALVKHAVTSDAKVTKFLSLDKCLPRRQFLQVVDVPHDSSKPMKLQLDPEWLAILKSTNHLLSFSKVPTYTGSLPGERQDFSATQSEMNLIVADFGGVLTIPEKFQQTVPAYDPEKSKNQNKCPPAQTQINPQTTLLCSMLDLTDPNAVFLGKDSSFKLPDDADLDNSETVNSDDDNDDVNDDEVESEASFVSLSGSERSFSDRSFGFTSTGNDSIASVNDSFVSLGNPEEISVDDIDEEDEGDIDNSKIEDTRAQCDRKVVESGSYEETENGASPLCVQKLGNQGKRLSLSERLQNCKPASTSGLVRTDTVEVDDEFAEIMVAQKMENKLSNVGLLSPPKSDSDSDIVDSKNSSSSIDCHALEISDDDPELREMLQAQKSLNDSLKADSDSSKHENKDVIEISADSDELESQEIIATRKKNQAISENESEFQKDFEINRPGVQSSPIVTIDSKLAENEASALIDKAGTKRVEEQKVEGKSPAAKKFKRRNLDMYVGDSVDNV